VLGLPQDILRNSRFASTLPQDSPRELMFDPCAKHNPAASASLRWNLPTLREQRIDRARC
jgi:hypothetical protein